MDKELRSFGKTLRQFYKESRKIKRQKPQAHARLRRIVILTTLAMALMAVVIPPFRIPVDGHVTSGFFLRKRPEALFPISLELHRGVDFGSPAGTKVYSTAPGVVRVSGYSDSYGNYVVIRHLLGVESYYAHLAKSRVNKGDTIIFRSLRSIGEVGSTGRATGPHLHFETRFITVALPPRFLLILHALRKAILGV